MPPRYAFWTILIGEQATAFRARERDELVPTLVQLQRKHPEAQMKWFAHGSLWDSPEQQQWAQKNKNALREKRSAEWRPGGAHKDPRAKFKKRKGPRRPPQARPFDARPRDERPRSDRPRDARPRDERPRGDRPRDDRPRDARPRTFDNRGPRPGRPLPPRRRKPEPEDR